MICYIILIFHNNNNKKNKEKTLIYFHYQKKCKNITKTKKSIKMKKYLQIQRFIFKK